MDTVAPTIGHNQPPALPSPETIAETLAAENAPLLKRRGELMQAVARVPVVIQNEEEAGKLADFIKQVDGCNKAAETAREGAKAPWLDGGRAVDGFFRKQFIDPLADIKTDMNRRQKAYLTAKAAEERRLREIEAQAAAAEAERQRKAAAEAAEIAANYRQIDEAIAMEASAETARNVAATAAAAAEAPVAKLSQTRGNLGSMSQLRDFWTFEGMDRAALDLEALRQHLPEEALKQAVRSFIRAGGRELPGVRIFNDPQPVTR